MTLAMWGDCKRIESFRFESFDNIVAFFFLEKYLEALAGLDLMRKTISQECEPKMSRKRHATNPILDVFLFFLSTFETSKYCDHKLLETCYLSHPTSANRIDIFDFSKKIKNLLLFNIDLSPFFSFFFCLSVCINVLFFCLYT